MAHRVAPRAAADLDDIWFYVAGESSSVRVADRLIDSITRRFSQLARHPYLGRARDDNLGPGFRSFPVGECVIVYYIDHQDVLILRVVHGRRDIEALFGR